MKKDGIVFYNVTNGAIKYNLIGSNRNGIIFRDQYLGKENSDDNIISNNSIIYNTNDGIHFEHTLWGWHSRNNVISNYIFSNTRGIYMIMSANNQILYNNIISNDGYGIQLDRCIGGGEHNIIHHNNICDNKGDEGQVCEWGDPINYWNDSYPSGGNYWSDYIEKDQYSGPNQDLPGSDGIGDVPYVILGGNSQDNYPFMDPFIDNAPEVTIVNPSEGYFHFSGIKLFPTVSDVIADTMGFGGFRLRPIQVKVEDDLDPPEDVDVYMFVKEDEQGEMMWNSDSNLFERKWIGPDLGVYTLNITAEDTSGNIGYAEIKVWYFCFIPE
jgi:parallel beta-helix repeat protein